MKKILTFTTAILFALSSSAFAAGHSAASDQGDAASGQQATTTPEGLVNGNAKSGKALGSATKKPGQAKKDP